MRLFLRQEWFSVALSSAASVHLAFAASAVISPRQSFSELARLSVPAQSLWPWHSALHPLCLAACALVFLGSLAVVSVGENRLAFSVLLGSSFRSFALHVGPLV